MTSPTLNSNVMWCADGTCHFRYVDIDVEQPAPRAAQFALDQNIMTDTMYPTSGARVFYNLQEAYMTKIVEKISQTPYETHMTRTSALLPDAEVVWLKISVPVVVETRRGDTYEILSVFMSDATLGTYTPDGTSSTGSSNKWIPIPLPVSGLDIIFTVKDTTTNIYAGNQRSLLESIAFGKNPWKHAVCSALISVRELHGLYATPVNPHGITKVNNSLCMVQNMLKMTGSVTLFAPIVPSGQDKLLYIMEHGPNALNMSRMTLHVNNKPVENFRHNYVNAFSKHLNGRGSGTYFAVKIPANYVEDGQAYIKVVIDTKGTSLIVSEVGTHDMFIQIMTPNQMHLTGARHTSSPLVPLLSPKFMPRVGY